MSSLLLACRNLVEGVVLKREAEVGSRRGRPFCAADARLRALATIKSCGVSMAAVGNAAFEGSVWCCTCPVAELGEGLWTGVVTTVSSTLQETWEFSNVTDETPSE